jgi:hypothetical protein
LKNSPPSARPALKVSRALSLQKSKMKLITPVTAQTARNLQALALAIVNAQNAKSQLEDALPTASAKSAHNPVPEPLLMKS